MPASPKLLVDVVSPVFAVILVGGLVGGWFRLDVRHVDRLALYAAVPALAFRALAELALGEIPAAGLAAPASPREARPFSSGSTPNLLAGPRYRTSSGDLP